MRPSAGELPVSLRGIPRAFVSVCGPPEGVGLTGRERYPIGTALKHPVGAAIREDASEDFTGFAGTQAAVGGGKIEGVQLGQVAGGEAQQSLACGQVRPSLARLCLMVGTLGGTVDLAPWSSWVRRSQNQLFMPWTHDRHPAIGGRKDHSSQ